MLKSAIFGAAAVLGQSRTTVKEFEFGRISLGSGFQSVRGFELENDFITCTVLSYGNTVFLTAWSRRGHVVLQL
jgi:hypothetical protein